MSFKRQLTNAINAGPSPRTWPRVCKRCLKPFGAAKVNLDYCSQRCRGAAKKEQKAKSRSDKKGTAKRKKGTNDA